MAAAGPAAAALSIASLGLGAMSDINKGRGERAAHLFEAERAKRAADFGRVRADQTDAQLREELNTTLTNIDSVRAAASVDPTSPTGLAIKDNEARIANRERATRVFNIRAQAEEDDMAAAYKRRTASDVLRSSYLNAGSRVVGGLAPLLRG